MIDWRDMHPVFDSMYRSIEMEASIATRREERVSRRSVMSNDTKSERQGNEWSNGPNAEVALRRAVAVRDAVRDELGGAVETEALDAGERGVRAEVRHQGLVVWSLSWVAKDLAPRGRETWGWHDGPGGSQCCDAGALSIADGMNRVLVSLGVS